MIALMSCNNSIPSHPIQCPLPCRYASPPPFDIFYSPRSTAACLWPPSSLPLSHVHIHIRPSHSAIRNPHSTTVSPQSLFIVHASVPISFLAPLSPIRCGPLCIPYTLVVGTGRTVLNDLPHAVGVPQFPVMTGVCLAARRSQGHLSSPCSSCSHLSTAFLVSVHTCALHCLILTHVDVFFQDGPCIPRRRRLDVDAMPSCGGSNVRNGSDASWLLASGIWLQSTFSPSPLPDRVCTNGSLQLSSIMIHDLFLQYVLH